ncbi:hypothetical protein QTP70_019218, partial [Hemibagrus guttatus]
TNTPRELKFINSGFSNTDELYTLSRLQYKLLIHQIKMKHSNLNPEQSRLFLEVHHIDGVVVLPLHSSIALFLLSYTECKSFQVSLVSDQLGSIEDLAGFLPKSLAVSEVKRTEAPALVAACRLPAVLELNGRFCRAGLAVVLRHIIQTTCCLEPQRRDVASLLGFKKTCLKACAEVSRWTRLCELDIPSAVEDHLRNPAEERLHLPAALLQLEHRLAEPVKVHNDDKLRRHKLQQQKNSERNSEKNSQPSESQQEDPQNQCGVELSAALAKMSVDGAPPVPTTRERSDVRKVKTTELPELEHVFAEGLYFTLTDVVLLPCVHQFLISLQNHAPHVLLQLPLLLRWYHRVQEVPGVRCAAEDCGIALFRLQVPQPCSIQAFPPHCVESEQESPAPSQEHFVGGPRPTLTKLQEHGIEAVFSPHPCPAWTLDWESLPAAVNPTEGELLGDVDPEELGYTLNSSSVDVNGSMTVISSTSEVHDDLLCFPGVEFQVVVHTPSHKVLDLLPVRGESEQSEALWSWRPLLTGCGEKRTGVDPEWEVDSLGGGENKIQNYMTLCEKVFAP